MGRWRASLVLKHIFTNRNPISNTNPYHKYINCSTPINKFLHFRPFSALPYPRPIYNDEEYEFNNKTHEDDDDFDQTNCIFPHKDGEIIPVKAYFLCTSIDLKGMQTENSRFYVPPTSRSSNYIALRFTPPQVNGIKYEMNASTYQYMVVFDYGSTVLFNVEDHEIEYYLQSVRKHATGLLPEMKKDDYVVKEKPLLEEDMQGGSDHIVLKNVDIDSIRIIGSVLGQSIALDYFVSQVDGMVQEFADINREMEKLGTFTMDRKKLFKLVGKANSNLADLILKVGIFERSEIAWRDAKYAQILEYLREEYEVTQRFGNLNFKRKFVEHNIHFLQEVLQNRKSDLLEWCIIILLSIENVIGLYEIVRDSSGVS